MSGDETATDQGCPLQYTAKDVIRICVSSLVSGVPPPNRAEDCRDLQLTQNWSRDAISYNNVPARQTLSSFVPAAKDGLRLRTHHNGL